MKIRCEWSKDNDLELSYHDIEWGVPIHDDKLLFELLILEGAQAGLNWLTVLKKRENYRKAFDNFDVFKVSEYDEEKVAQLLKNAGIIRNRLKIRSAIANAQAFLIVEEAFGTFDYYIWSFVDGLPIQNSWKDASEVPTSTPLSDKISKDLKSRGFNFVGTTICYAYMQAIGMVNDHTVDCFRHTEV